MVSTMYIGGVETVDPRIMSIQVTTVGAATFTIDNLTVDVGKTEIVDWGDGSRSSYTGTGSRSHAYTGAGTWTVRFNYPTAILALDIRDAKASVKFSEIKKASSILQVILYGCRVDGNSSDLSNLRPTIFYLISLISGSQIVFNSADIAAWSPIEFQLNALPSGVSGVLNSSDFAAWSPNVFILSFLDSTALTGTINSSDFAAWTPNYFTYLSPPVVFTGTFSSANLTAWRPTTFYFGYTVAPYTVVFNTSHLSSWNPTLFYWLIVGGGTNTTPAGGLSGWTACHDATIFNLALTQAQVDQILADLYTAFATRTVSGGLLELHGDNAAPSGIYQAQCPPTTGKEYKYELLNDSCAINPTKKWTTITTN